MIDTELLLSLAGLLPPTITFLPLLLSFPTRRTGARSTVGKTVVSSQMINRVTAKLGPQALPKVPVGFKWFVDGLLDGSIGFGREESGPVHRSPALTAEFDDR